MTNPYPSPRSVLVMDNAQIHHAEAIKDLVHGMVGIYCLSINYSSTLGWCIKYLLPYSPDYNLIEQAFSVIKVHLCWNGISFLEPDALYFEMYQVCDCITPEMMWFFFFAHSGYMVWQTRGKSVQYRQLCIWALQFEEYCTIWTIKATE